MQFKKNVNTVKDLFAKDNGPDILLLPGEEKDNVDIVMGDKCYKCGEAAYDDCTICGRPACLRHGKRVGDNFVCRSCVNDY